MVTLLNPSNRIKYYGFVLVLLPLMVLASCSKKHSDVLTLDIKGNMETSPNPWITPQPFGETYSYTTEAYSSANHSLKISIPSDTIVSPPFWYNRYTGTMPVGKDVVLSVSIKGVNVTGEGAAIEIGAYDANDNVLIYASAGPGTGTFEWTTFRTKLENIPSNTDHIAVFLYTYIHTQGVVYFDDATLTID